MAQQLDLQEQEQLDALKAFWAAYGNLIVWALTLVLALFAAWNYWNSQVRKSALEASGFYGSVQSAANGGDAARAAQVFGDMKGRKPWFVPAGMYEQPAWTQQAGLLVAKVQADKGQAADAQATLQWVVDHGNPENAAVAHLRLAGLLADQKKFDEAGKELDAVKPDSFKALVADRRGDIALARGDRAAAVSAWQAARDALPATQAWRNVVDAKLTAQGAAPAASDAASAAGGAQ